MLADVTRWDGSRSQRPVGADFKGGGSWSAEVTSDSTAVGHPFTGMSGPAA